MSIANIPHALPTGGTLFRNAITNGGFNVNQRMTLSNMTSMSTTSMTSPTPSPYFVADRWIAYRTGLVANGQMALMTLSNADLPFTSAGITNFARIGRSSGDTSLANINLVTNIETLNSIPLAAKVVTLSFYCRAGANYYGSSSISLAIGVLVDQNYAINSLGAGASLSTNSFAATTTWQRFSYSYSVNSNATQVAPLISYTPSGTAGASDYLDFTGVQLEIASSATNFELRPYSVELSLCQRYFQRTQSMSNGSRFAMVTCVNPSGYWFGFLTLCCPLRSPSQSTISGNGLTIGTLSVTLIYQEGITLGSTSTYSFTVSTSAASQGAISFLQSANATQFLDISNEL